MIKIKRKMVRDWGIFLLLVLGYWILTILNNQDNEKLLSNPNLKFAIGTVSHFKLAKTVYRGGTPTSIKYKFMVDDHECETGYSTLRYPIPTKGIYIGDRYLVAYILNGKGDNSLMLFDYPIKDSTDFQLAIDCWKENQLKEQKKQNE